MKTEIVFEDNDIIVIRKPAGLATQTARIGQVDVVSELKNYLAKKSDKKEQPYVGIIHRLDQPVEGLLVFAKNKNAAADLSNQLSGSNNTLNKQYYAVFCGKPVSTQGELVDYLIKTSDGCAKIVSEKENGAKKAILQYKVVESVQLEDYTEICMADIHIETGRFHQIRVQMSHAGMALLGDSKYGDEKSVSCSKKNGVASVALCAYHLELKHPVSKKVMNFQVAPSGKIFQSFHF